MLGNHGLEKINEAVASGPQYVQYKLITCCYEIYLPMTI